MNKTIKIACTGAALVPIDHLEIMQGDLKSLSKASYQKLKRSIERHGFTAPIFVWRGKNKILDGTQRLRAVQQMLKEGYELPEGKLPVCWIDASNIKEAKEILLTFVSQYGKIESQGLYEFLADNDPLDFGEVKLEIDLPEIDIGDFETEFFTSDSDNNSKTSSLEKIYEVVITCANEQEQQSVFEKLNAEGLKCRLLTL